MFSFCCFRLIAETRGEPTVLDKPRAFILDGQYSDSIPFYLVFVLAETRYQQRHCMYTDVPRPSPRKRSRFRGQTTMCVTSFFNERDEEIHLIAEFHIKPQGGNSLYKLIALPYMNGQELSIFSHYSSCLAFPTHFQQTSISSNTRPSCGYHHISSFCTSCAMLR